ncbi:MAG: DsbA family protein [Gammaproteobacteria bacterium]|jgi:2-hydroxychromene-2-carboxylate isomerase|nr:DsbA family protein [Gammaproteobacteria bacterium]MDP6617493.1 DsbA family protein [Gammaproteobacteria bacterium]MDP6695636.1 DsbA family protein [Gammaproteobacteria bacterium]MDP7041886.1 DsbA family protein [Gammaproteobacteria bacterium]
MTDTMPEGGELDFFFDYSCPWSFIGFVRLLDVATRNRTRINYRPVSVTKILATENPGLQATRLSANPAKAAWQLRDLGEWARFWGLPMNLPANWPFDPAAALQGGVVAAAQGMAEGYTYGVFEACFGAGADICDTQVVTKLAAAAGMERELFEEQLNAPETVAAVAKNVDDLLQKGGFGTPSMLVDNELLFGNDRMALVEFILGPVGQEDFVMPGQHDKF